MKIILIDFHALQVQSPISWNHSSQTLENNSSYIYHLYERLKRKFENQSKGFSKWLLVREKWLDVTFLNLT